MDKIYSRFDKRSFKLSAIGILILADVCLLFSIYKKFSSRAFFDRTLDLLFQLQPQQAQQFNPALEGQLHSLMVNSLITMLLLVLAYHLFVHILWWKEKFVARGYFLLYSWTAGVSLSLYGVTNLVKNFTGSLFYLVLGLAFLFVAIGMGYFPEENPKKRNAKKK